MNDNEIKTYLVFDSIYSKHPFYEVTPQKNKWNTKKIKTSSTVSKISKLKSPNNMQSSDHKRVWQKPSDRQAVQHIQTPKSKVWNILSANILSAVFLNILSAVDC